MKCWKYRGTHVQLLHTSLIQSCITADKDNPTKLSLFYVRDGVYSKWGLEFNILRPEQNGRYFADSIIQRSFLKETFVFLLRFYRSFVLMG